MAVDVLVTGASGALGGQIVETLRANGHCVAASGRVAGTKVDTVWNISRQDGPAPDCQPKVVVHSAARIGSYQQPLANTDALFDVNVTGTLRLARWCISVQIEQLILISGAIVYGEWDESPKDENSPPQPWKAGPYAVSKWCGEQVAALVNQAGIQLTVLRLSSLYGTEYESGLVQRLLKEGRETGVIKLKPPVDDAFDLLHLQDAARAVECALKVKHQGLWNIGGGGLTTIGELAELCAERTGAEVVLSDSEPVRPKRVINWIDDSKARRDLDYRNSVSVESGIDAIAADQHTAGATSPID